MSTETKPLSVHTQMRRHIESQLGRKRKEAHNIKQDLLHLAHKEDTLVLLELEVKYLVEQMALLPAEPEPKAKEGNPKGTAKEGAVTEPNGGETLSKKQQKAATKKAKQQAEKTAREKKSADLAAATPAVKPVVAEEVTPEVATPPVTKPTIVPDAQPATPKVDPVVADPADDKLAEQTARKAVLLKKRDERAAAKLAAEEAARLAQELLDLEAEIAALDSVDAA
jgi:hypothetical protein